MDYVVKGKSVHYQCEKCGVDLESQLNEAGSTDECPFCHQKFIVPGVKEKAVADEAAAKEAAEKARRLADEQRRIEERERFAKEREAEEAEKIRRLNAGMAEAERRAIEELKEEERSIHLSSETGTNEVTVPHYDGLSVIASILRGVGVLTAVLFGIMGLLDGTSRGLLIAGGGVLYGVFQFALASAAEGFRDMIRNSYHQRNLLSKIVRHQDQQRKEQAN